MLLVFRLLLIFLSLGLNTSSLLLSPDLGWHNSLQTTTLYHNTEEMLVYLLTIVPFNVCWALSQEYYRCGIAWKMRNLLLYKVFNWPSSKSCISHPWSKYAYLMLSLCCSPHLDSLQPEGKSLYLFPLCQQAVLTVYLHNLWSGVFEIVSDALFSACF